jgi:tripartite-type tricarboxylate transporter receptor subunit TctC
MSAENGGGSRSCPNQEGSRTETPAATYVLIRERLGASMKFSSVAIVAGIAAGAFLECIGTAQAQFTLQGKTVTLYAAVGVGGGGDTIVRTFIPYLSKRLPGDPTIIVKNMPGGGGMQGVQYLYNVAPGDGTAFGLTPAGPIKEPLVGTSGKANYDLRKFHWFGSLAEEDSVCAIWHTSPIKSLKDAQSHEVSMASTGVSSNSTMVPLMMNDLLKTRFKPVSGYDGGTSLLAMERGEMDGRCMAIGSLRAARPNWLTEKLVRILFVTNDSDDPDLKDVPRVSSFLKSEDDRKALAFFQMPDEIQDPMMLPPGVSADIVAAYRRAFDAAVQDKDYLTEVDRRKQSIVIHNGEQVQATIQAMYDTPPEVVKRVARATAAKGGGKEK